MKTLLHKSATRGHANHGWLDSHHTFSFADYYDPERVHFGMLRVLNDDIVAGGKGFGMHPHENMEIVSIPLEGDLEHQDSTGSKGIIRYGEIQVMSAGTGVFHSEYNAHKDLPVKFLQIWVFPDQVNVTPRYQQAAFNFHDPENVLHQVVSPDKSEEGLWIHQNAWFHIGIFHKDISFSYKLNRPQNGVYVFIIMGCFEVNGQQMEFRDGMGIWEISELSITSKEDNAEILLIEIPMEKGK